MDRRSLASNRSLLDDNSQANEAEQHTQSGHRSPECFLARNKMENSKTNTTGDLVSRPFVLRAAFGLLQRCVTDQQCCAQKSSNALPLTDSDFANFR